MRRATVVSRKDELGLHGQAELLHASTQAGWRLSRSQEAIRNKGALRGVPPEREEHILAQLVGISADQTRMWPEFVRLLEEAHGRDWGRSMVVVSPDGEAKNLTVRTFGTFEAVYAELVEPWLGSWAELRATYAKFQAGEISQEQGAEEIKLRARPGRPRKDEDNSGDRQKFSKAEQNTVEHIKARLRRDDPELAAQVERGEITANAAAVAKGWRKKHDPGRQLDKAWDAATPEQRAACVARKAAAVHEPNGLERLRQAWRDTWDAWHHVSEDERAAFMADHSDEMRQLRQLLDGPRP
jgi:hypothetical protein